MASDHPGGPGRNEHAVVQSLIAAANAPVVARFTSATNMDAWNPPRGHHDLVTTGIDRVAVVLAVEWARREDMARCWVGGVRATGCWRWSYGISLTFDVNTEISTRSHRYGKNGWQGRNRTYMVLAHRPVNSRVPYHSGHLPR